MHRFVWLRAGNSMCDGPTARPWRASCCRTGEPQRASRLRHFGCNRAHVQADHTQTTRTDSVAIGATRDSTWPLYDRRRRRRFASLRGASCLCLCVCAGVVWHWLEPRRAPPWLELPYASVLSAEVGGGGGGSRSLRAVSSRDQGAVSSRDQGCAASPWYFLSRLCRRVAAGTIDRACRSLRIGLPGKVLGKARRTCGAYFSANAARQPSLVLRRMRAWAS